MNKILLFLLLICSSGIEMSAQAVIDFQPKMLDKCIIKVFEQSEIKLEPLLPGKPEISEQLVNGLYYNIISSDFEVIGYSYVGRANSCKISGCDIKTDVINESGYEFFDYFILYDTSVTVMKVKVFNYQSTHGHEVTAEGWLKQFVGYNQEKSLDVGKEVDAISGATVTVDALTFDVKRVTKLLNRWLRNE
ncbi:MAG: FMN-binding protein [Bacteroidales bacterium]|nr:FMN-binding protein [Bacteroidales bacterium]